MAHKRTSKEGYTIGKMNARLAELGQRFLDDDEEPGEMCKTCAFRLNTVPNGCLQTQMDVMKSLKENRPFTCHHKEREGEICHGRFAAEVYLRRNPTMRQLMPQTDYPYSPEDA